MTLDIIPSAGLCNRMRVVASGYECARERGLEARVLWDTTNPGCRAAFHSLFLPVEVEGIVVEDTSALFAQAQSRRNLYIPKLLRRLRYSTLIENYNWNWTGKKLELPDAKGSMAIYSMHQCGPNYPLSELFRPVPVLASRIDELVPDGPVVGVHIRRTDHVQSIRHASVEDYIGLMDKEIASDDAVRFFLATDDESVKRRLIGHFGKDRISTSSGRLRRDTLEGIEGAVVDLFALSRCNRILGSYYSSYSEIAAELGQIDLIIP